MASVTIKQVAERAGVSAAAVSYVLNGKKGVSAETRDRVNEVINELNYSPNLNSRRLIMRRSFNIILAVNLSMSLLDDAFFMPIIKSILERCWKLNYNMVVATYSDVFSGSQLAHLLSQNNADGVIFLRDLSEQMQDQMDEIAVPYIVIDSHNTASTYPHICCDYRMGAYIGTKYLIEQGHSSIGFVGSSIIPAFYLKAFSGYKSAMAEANLPVQLDWIQSNAADPGTAEECMANILKCAQHPTAIFCSGDILAIGVVNHLQNNGYSIPGDFSICSMDNTFLAQHSNPALTSVSIDKENMGELAVNTLDLMINGQETDTAITVNTDQLAIRGSIRKLG